MDVKDLYPGFCLGNYDPTARECNCCDIQDECKEETENNENDDDIDTDDCQE